MVRSPQKFLFLVLLFWVNVVHSQIQPETELKEIVSEKTVIEELVYLEDWEQEAQFPGGTVALLKFIKDNISYPPEAVAEKITGKVYLGFIVEKNGSLSNVEVLRGIHPLIDAEAIRIIQSMPNWIPGTLNNEPARTRLRIPISFDL
jgi:TonB family protein